MTWEIVDTIGNVLFTAIFVVWCVLLFLQRKMFERSEKSSTQVIETMEEGVAGLKRAALAALWLKHARYASEDEDPPLTVKCLDCGDTCGTVETVEEIMTVAKSHVDAKYQEVVEVVQAAETK